jgi:hypothetical protein
MTIRRSVALLASAVGLLSIVACKSPAPADTAAPTAEGTAAAAPAAEAPAAATPPAAAPAADSPRTAPVAANGVAGPYNGTLTRGTDVTQNYTVTVMTDRNGTPQVGFWEFCNVDFPGSSGTYSAAPGSSCLVDLDGTGTKPQNIAGGLAVIGEGTINATITFENGTVWSFVGSR